MWITWAPWEGITRRLGFEAARHASKTRRLIRHDYGLSLYLGEKVIRQHSPLSQLLAPAFPPSMKRRSTYIHARERDILFEGIHYTQVMIDMPYPTFAATYLLVETSGVTP